MTQAPLTVSLLITSYYRPEHLRRCLDSALAQTLRPNQIVIVARDSDLPTQQIAREYAARRAVPIDLGIVSEPGVVAANNVGLELVKGDIVAFVDDDSTMPPEWLGSLVRHYADPSVGAVGGRVENHRNGQRLYAEQHLTSRSMRIDRWGRVGSGQMYSFSGLHEVDHLAGGNMSFRRSALPRCDTNILGDGFRYEMDLCLSVRAAGYRVLADGEAVNQHWCAPREGVPPRHDPYRGQYCNRHNESYMLAKHSCHLWGYVVRQIFWVLPRQAIRSLAHRDAHVCYEAAGFLRGLFRGLSRGRRVRAATLTAQLRQSRASGTREEMLANSAG